MTKPNIILINCDDLGYGDLGCYGSKKNSTPTLDRMADEGILFTDFYMASPVCSPSRGAMMTGCYPPRIGFGSFDGDRVLFPGQAIGLNPKEITISQLLKDVGYSTKIVGKWHCGDQNEFLPTNHGFDSYFGLPYSNDMGRQQRAQKLNQKKISTRLKDAPPLPLLRDEKVIQEQPDQSSLTERYVDECIQFIRQNSESPFFLYLAHMYVHLPIYAPDRFLRESKNGTYGAAVAGLDWAASVIMHEIRELGLDEDTLIIFTSDNGSNMLGKYGSNGPLRGTKGTTWEGGQRVPCIMRWPSKISNGKVCRELTTSMDLYPTLASIAGAEIPHDRIIDGKNIGPLIFSDTHVPSPHHAFFYYNGNNLEAVRSGNWKLHSRKDETAIEELYDLNSDVGEQNNLFVKNPEIIEELNVLLDQCREDIGDASTGKTGRNKRPVGRVENPETLTHYDPNYPYIIEMYDLKDRG